MGIVLVMAANHPNVFSRPFLFLSPSLSIFLPLSPSEEGDEEALSKKEEEERRIAEMGRPTLGEHVKLEVVIEESYEFKVRDHTSALVCFWGILFY